MRLFLVFVSVLIVSLACGGKRVTTTKSGSANAPSVDYSQLAVTHQGASVLPAGGYYSLTRFEDGSGYGGANIAKGKVGCSTSFSDAVLFSVSNVGLKLGVPTPVEPGQAVVSAFDTNYNELARKGFSGTVTTLSLSDTEATVRFDLSDPAGFGLKGEVKLPVCRFGPDGRAL